MLDFTFYLTGEHYLGASTIPETLVATYRNERPSLFEAGHLSPEFRTDRERCAALDSVLMWATRSNPAERVQTPCALGDLLLPLFAWPGGTAPGVIGAPPLPSRLPSGATAYEFTTRALPLTEFSLKSVGWDTDGHFLGVTVSGGLVYWDGWNFRRAPFDSSFHRMLLPNRTPALAARRTRRCGSISIKGMRDPYSTVTKAVR